MGAICSAREMIDLIYEFGLSLPKPDEIELIEDREKRVICRFLWELYGFLLRLPSEIDDYDNLVRASHVVSTVLCLGEEIEELLGLYFPDLVPLFKQIRHAMRELRDELIPYIPILE